MQIGSKKNYVSGFVEVISGLEYDFPVIFVISLAVLEISVNYCKRKPKKVFSQGSQIRIEKNQVSRFLGVILCGELEFSISFVIS